MAASEMAPLARTGSLGDALGALPAELQARGHEVSVILPCYRSIREDKSLEVERTGVEMTIEVGPRRIETEILETCVGKVQVFLVRRDEYFDRPELYGSGGRAYDDNAERFIFFSKAVVELARRVNPTPDVVHVHDWQTALVPVFMRDRQLPIRSLLTLHNVAYQGNFWGLDFGLTNLPDSYFSASGIEFYGRINFLKGGILHAHALTAVSERYARDIQTPESGAGLEAVLREQAGKLSGILNGLDSKVWNPAGDKFIAKKYKPSAPAGKKNCRNALLQELGLEKDPRGPVFNMVTRLAEQKGFDLLIPLLDRFLADDVRLVILAEGDADYARDLTIAAKRNPGRFAFRRGADDPLAHRIYAGSDVTLLPSHYEPAAAAALISLKYGCIPVARACGGLHQVLSDYDPTAGTGAALLFYEQTPEALWDAIRRAKRLAADPETWKQLVQRAMKYDFSWAKTAAEYEKVYARLL